MDNDYLYKCCLNIGKIDICLKCPTKQFRQAIQKYLQADDYHENYDILLEIKRTTKPETVKIPDSLFTTKKINNIHFNIADNLVKGYFDPLKRTGMLKVHHWITTSSRARVFEQLLYQAFYSAAKIKKYKANLIHASGVKKEDAGILFTGPSGSGKTTVVQLSKDYKVLNDEICLIEPGKKGYILYSTPFNGFFTQKQKGSAKLKAILILKQSKVHKISRIKSTETVKSIFKEIVPPIGLEEKMDSAVHSDMLNYAISLAQDVPVYQLEFLPDNGFWFQIDKIIKAESDLWK